MKSARTPRGPATRRRAPLWARSRVVSIDRRSGPSPSELESDTTDSVTCPLSRSSASSAPANAESVRDRPLTVAGAEAVAGGDAGAASVASLVSISAPPQSASAVIGAHLSELVANHEPADSV